MSSFSSRKECAKRVGANNKLTKDLKKLVKEGELTEIQAKRLLREGATLGRGLDTSERAGGRDSANLEYNKAKQEKKVGKKRDVPQEESFNGLIKKRKISSMPDYVKSALGELCQKSTRELRIFDVRSNQTISEVQRLRENGEPFILVGHSGFTDFAKSWDYCSHLNKNGECWDGIPNELLRLQVPIVRKGETSSTSFHPIHERIPFQDFLSKYWQSGDASCYLHQWQFPVESKRARRLMGARSQMRRIKPNNLRNCKCHDEKKAGNDSLYKQDVFFQKEEFAREYLPSCMNYDMLEDWKDSLDGENPFQYLFVGATATNSVMHKDSGGLGIFIAPICGKKEITLVHRDDGHYLYQMSQFKKTEVDFQKNPLVHYARIWKHVLLPGDVAYLPAGTYHRCRNIEACISYHRFHLDEVNLPFFMSSFFNGDAVEIDHDDVIWNTIHVIMAAYPKIVNTSFAHKYKNMLLLLRQIAATMAYKLCNCDWENLVVNIDATLSATKSPIKGKLDPAVTKNDRGKERVGNRQGQIEKDSVSPEVYCNTNAEGKTAKRPATTKLGFTTRKENSNDPGSSSRGILIKEQRLANVLTTTPALSSTALESFVTKSTCNLELNVRVKILRHEEMEEGVIVGIRKHAIVFKCHYIGWDSKFDEYIPLENIINSYEGNEGGVVKVIWGKNKQVFKAKICKPSIGAIVLVHIPKLGEDWNTWMPANEVRVPCSDALL